MTEILNNVPSGELEGKKNGSFPKKMSNSLCTMGRHGIRVAVFIILD